MKKAVYFLLAALVFVCGSGCEKQEKTIELVTQYSGAELDLCGDELREYLSEDDFTAQCNFLLEHEGDYYDWQNIMLIWNESGSDSYTVYISADSSFTSSYTYTTD